MRREIRMPSVTPSMTDARIARWHVAEGQTVAPGDVLAEVATTTATLEIEAENEGRVERILVPAGTEGVKADTPIAILLGTARPSASRGDRPAPSPILTFAALGPADTFDKLDTPAPAGVETTYREALRDALAEEMRRDPDVFLIGVDVVQNRGALKVTQGLEDEFGARRVVSVPPLDEALMGVALGAAMAGLKPVVEVSNWGRAFEALGPYLATAAQTFYLSGGAQAVPVVLRGPNGLAPGQTGEDARCVASLLARIPGLKVVQPATPSAAKALLKAAIRDNGPVAVLEHEELYATRAPIEDVEVKLGAARIARAGSDVTVVAAGRATILALAAAETLASNGIAAEVVDLMSVRPLDRNTVVASVKRTGRLVTVEDGDGGIGAELIAAVAEEAWADLERPPVRLAGAPVPMPYATELQAMAIPRSEDIVRAIERLLRA